MDEGSKIPEISVTIDNAVVSLASLGAPLVVYFYPKDDTAGCTTEAKDFSVLSDAFEAAGVTVVGVSKDTAASHAKFTAKHGLAVRLASDVEGVACEAFGVWVEKAMYGRKYMGIERATFLFGADGMLAKAWRKVRVAGHAEAVLAAANAL
jgi:peroxiredoxin Q/BCP